MTNYIERYWRDAKPEDATKEPPMVARLKVYADDTEWRIGCLTGFDRKPLSSRDTWFSEEYSAEICQVYDAPDPGEGWRLIDIDKDQPPVGDEYYEPWNHTWHKRDIPTASFAPKSFYRRRITPPEPKYVPFTWEDREQLRGRWITRDNREVLIAGLSNDDNFYASGYGMEILCKYWRFLDTGEPVGKKVQ